jgi:hypothetical protein
VNRRTVILILSLSAIVLASAFIVHRLRNPVAGRVITDYAEFIGEQLGKAVLGVEPAPARLVIIVAGGVNAADPFTEGYIRGLERTVREKSPGVSTARDKVVTDFMAMQRGAPVFSAEDFRRIVESHPDGNLFVSLTGVPEYREGLLPEGRTPALVALAVYGGAMEQWFSAGVLRAAVVPNTGESRAAARAGPGLKARFEREYRILKPET